MRQSSSLPSRMSIHPRSDIYVANVIMIRMKRPAASSLGSPLDVAIEVVAHGCLLYQLARSVHNKTGSSITDSPPSLAVHWCWDEAQCDSIQHGPICGLLGFPGPHDPARLSVSIDDGLDLRLAHRHRFVSRTIWRERRHSRHPTCGCPCPFYPGNCLGMSNLTDQLWSVTADISRISSSQRVVPPRTPPSTI